MTFCTGCACRLPAVERSFGFKHLPRNREREQTGRNGYGAPLASSGSTRRTRVGQRSAAVSVGAAGAEAAEPGSRQVDLDRETAGHAHAGPAGHAGKEAAMLNSKTLDELAARIGKALEGSPAKDIEKNVKAMLQSGLARLDLVTRQEFDIQAEVLRKTRDKVERLEARVAELEARVPPPPMV